MNEQIQIDQVLNILDRLIETNDQLLANSKAAINLFEIEKRAKMQAIAFIVASGNRQAFQQYARQTERVSTEDFHKFIIDKTIRELNAIDGAS